MISQVDLARLAREAHAALAGSVVHRAWREGEETWVLLAKLEGRARDRLALEIGLRPEGGRLVVLDADAVDADDSSEKKARKADSHFFLSGLRKMLPGCRIEAVSAAADDRLAFVDFSREEKREGETLPDRLELAVELTGRSTNLILIERPGKEEAETSPGKVLMALRPSHKGRELDSGKPYVRPKPRALREGEEPEPSAFPDIEPSGETLALSRAARAAALEAESAADATDRRSALLKAASQAARRAKGLVEKLEKERDEAKAAEDLRRKGELLKANASRVKKGETKLRVTDFFASSPAEVELEIDPLVPVMDQARALFKRAKKLDRGLVAIETRLGEADAQGEALERISKELEAASPDDEPALDAAEKELSKLGVKPVRREPLEQKPPERKKDDEPRGPRRFESGGFTILVGRSNEENDRLTLTIARGNDLFFHVRGFPGSHVIVRTVKDKSVPLETLLDAAALAVHYSKVRGNARCDVTYTPRKYVRKPRGAKAGLVQVSNEKTIRPDGDPARLARLLASAGEKANDGLEDFS